MKKVRMLFEPMQIGNIKLKNRIVMAPMATNFPSPDGYVTQRHIDYYGERAKGGAGLIIVEGSFVEQKGRRLANQLSISDETCIKGMKMLVDEVHSCGSHIALQLTHGGRECSSKITGSQPMGPSSLPSQYRGITKDIEIPAEMSEQDISETIESFVRGAEVAKKAGFDLVEIHGAHGYLLSQFLSPAVNFRRDSYGGDTEGRARIVTELLDRIKTKLGKTLPIIIRFNGDDFLQGGIVLREAKILAKLFEEHGADALHVSGGFHASVPFYMIPPMGLPHNCLAHLAAGIKQEVKVPIVAVGRITDPGDAEKILVTGKADLIAFGRALIADPELPAKTQEKREEEIRPCIGCNQGCIGMIHKQLPLTCLLNPAAGREREFDITEVESKKRIVIVGAGPAGLEAARVAALRGHTVVLFEKENRIGGALNVAKIPPKRETIGSAVKYYEHIVKNLSLDVRLGKEAEVEDIISQQPDEVIIATGGQPYRPEFPGVHLPHVVFAQDVLTGKVRVGENIVIIGGGSVGLETAEFLLEKGKRVIVIEMESDIAIDMEPRSRSYLLYRLQEYPLEVLLNEKVVEIVSDGVIITNGQWTKQISRADNIVLAVGSTADQELGYELKERGMKVHFIGDCKRVRDAVDAVYEGLHLGAII